MQERKVILELKGISKSFPGVKALDQVSLCVREGTVHALMGENGAGKSTLMKCAFGLYTADEGEVMVNGEPVHFRSTRDAMDKGVAMIHQELQVVRARNVMENVWIGRIPYKRVLGMRWTDPGKMYRETKKIFDEFGIPIEPSAGLASLSVSYCQLIEIAKAVSFGARVIIMDEPTSSLSETEAAILFKIIKKLTGQGVAIIYISHKIDEILKISDEVTIMRDGQLVGSFDAADLNTDMVISKMVGREMTSRFPEKGYQSGAVHLEVTDLISANPGSFRNVSFTVRKGEIFGIGGLVGAQRTELIESIFGLRRISGGTIKKNGKELTITSPQEAIRHGLALLTEERRETGIVPMLSLVDNTVLANQSARKKEYRSRMLFLNNKKRRQETQHYVDALSVKTPGINQQIQYLSGGNQQKLLLGKWLLTEPDILILDEPTRGIDIGAKYDIYSILVELARQGKSVIVICSEMPELMGISDRIMVMCEGRVSGIIQGDEINEENIMRLASTTARH